MQGVNKGIVAKRLLSAMQGKGMSPDFVLCIGDDRSDEDMFEVITSSGPSMAPRAEVFACTVGRKPSKAKYYLDDTTDIVRMVQGFSLCFGPNSFMLGMGKKDNLEMMFTFFVSM
jgi:trehalose 6-phosphate synthase/phosphatase